jgi:hypothetical protein
MKMAYLSGIFIHFGPQASTIGIRQIKLKLIKKFIDRWMGLEISGHYFLHPVILTVPSTV